MNFIENFSDVIDGSVIVTSACDVGIACVSENGREVTLESFLLDGTIESGLSVSDLRDANILILSVAEAEQIFEPILKRAREAGFLTREEALENAAAV